MNHTATYSPEDNKLRVYPAQRLDDELGEEYAAFKTAGYKWAAKQECFVCARWTPAAEDWALRLAGQIDDEDYGATERAADRAERFGDYRDRRRDEAHGHADTFADGPAAFGHQSRARAERQAARHDRHRGRALCQWDKAEYWQERTAGVIAHALHRARPDVRRGRILTLESEQRKHLKSLADARARRAAWKRIAAEPDADKARQLAIALANASCDWGDYVHPRTGAVVHSMYSLLEADEANPITGQEAAELWLAKWADPDRKGASWHRWTAHYELRLSYERAMLENEGGSAAAVEMEPGGWIGRHQIQAVNKSPATGRVTSVKLWGEKDYYRGEPVLRADGTYGAPLVLKSVNIERMGESVYRAPTDEERAAFKASQAEKKAERTAKRKANPLPQLVNPTDADAERLQAIWNAEAEAKHIAAKKWGEFVPSEVVRLTQAGYSARSKGAYASFETRTLDVAGKPSRRSSNMWTREGADYDATLGATACKVRMASAAGSSWSSPPRLIVITDKPQKPLPLDWAKLGEQAAPEALPEPVAPAPAVAAEPAELVPAGLLF